MTIGVTSPGNITFAGTSEYLAEPLPFESLFQALRSAKGVTRHLDFYRWLQNEISEFVPHEVLLVAWGDFDKGDLSYDVSSVLPGVTTPFVSSLPGLTAMLSTFFYQAKRNASGWMVIEDFDEVSIKLRSRFVKRTAGVRMNAVLVYAMRDERYKRDCLYVFCSQNGLEETDPLLLDFIMPHMDAALRRVECLSCEEAAEAAVPDLPFSDILSGRECEVMNWVCEGKSNVEIGSILGISHNTVKNHLKRVFRKMDVKARSQAVQVYTKRHATQARV